MKAIIRVLFLLFFLNSFSQSVNNEQKINDLLGSYFFNDREVIHVQFNKMIYVNNEFVAFKGYVFSKNNKVPSSNTTNINLVIYNEKQEVVQKQLLYAANGTFSGNLQLNEKFVSGKYYFHFFTNWMNNFKEDDSFMQTIEIIDKNGKYNLKSKSPNLATASVELFPENSIIIDGVSNTIGVKLTDCNQIGIPAIKGTIVDSKSNEVTTFTTNKMGNGGFNFIPNLNEKYYLKINTDKINISEPLPGIQPTGIVLSYNNYLSSSLIIDVHTNTLGVEKYKNTKFSLLVYQNNVSVAKQFSFENNNPNQIIRLDKKLLENGVNNISVLDEDLNQVAERLVYIETKPLHKINLEARSSVNDSIALYGKLDLKSANISLSVLTQANAAVVQKKSILGTFLLNAYLEKPELNNFDCFDSENSNRKQDLELLMLNQERSKYYWGNILAGPSKINYSFEKGVTIDGRIENNSKPENKYKITLFSIKDEVWEQTIVENNKFKFEHFYAKDSTLLSFQLSSDKFDSKKIKIFPHVVPPKNRFVATPKFENAICPLIDDKEASFDFKNSNSDIIELSSVLIMNTNKKEKFLHKKDNNNSFLTSYKIKDEHGSIVNFINTHGFKVAIDSTRSVTININRNSQKNGKSTEVYVDDSQLDDLSSLYSIYMEDVDEVYFDKMGLSGGSNGVIKIYLKPNAIKDFNDPKTTTFMVTSGFASSEEYKNAEFESPKEFFAFGTLKWEPNVPISPNQDFNVKLVKANQQNIQVLIEGFDTEGQLFSEMKTIPVVSP